MSKKYILRVARKKFSITYKKDLENIPKTTECIKKNQYTIKNQYTLNILAVQISTLFLISTFWIYWQYKSVQSVHAANPASFTHHSFHPPYLSSTKFFTHHIFHPPHLPPTIFFTHHIFHLPQLSPTIFFTHHIFHSPYFSPTTSLTHHIYTIKFLNEDPSLYLLIATNEHAFWCQPPPIPLWGHPRRG